MMLATGARIKAIRVLADVSQEDVCRLFNLDQSAWSKWETGKRLADLATMIRFAVRFRASLDFIYRGVVTGCHPDLARLLEQQYPNLIAPPPSYRDRDTDTALASYRQSTGQPTTD